MKEMVGTRSKLIRFCSEMAQSTRNNTEMPSIAKLRFVASWVPTRKSKTVNFDAQKAETMQIDIVAFGFAVHLSFKNVF